jgi:hypothetical protein
MSRYPSEGSNATNKFMFVTDDRTFQLLRSKYASRIPGMRIVNLFSGEEHGPSHLTILNQLQQHPAR